MSSIITTVRTDDHTAQAAARSQSHTQASSTNYQVLPWEGLIVWSEH